MQPIASYQERRFDGQRNFELFAEHLTVKGRQTFGAEFETTIPLYTLSPALSHLRTRDRGFWSGIVMILIAISLLQSGALLITSYWGGLAAVMVVAGALLSIATARKVEWVQISSRAGFLSVTIARAGPDKSTFDKFINSLLEQIKTSDKHNRPEET
jgi:hypothetical protein